MSLNSKRLTAFILFAVFGAITSYFLFVVPISIFAIAVDRSGQAAGFLIAMLLMMTPAISIPAGVVAGLLTLPVMDRPLKAPVLSRSHSLTLVIASGVSVVVSTILTYISALIYALVIVLFSLIAFEGLGISY
jgi:hypothetical protein